MSADYAERTVVGLVEAWNTLAMASYERQEAIAIHASPEAVYDLISDVTRTGEWSPICKSCWWHDGDSAQVGAHFIGRNERDGHTWETVSEVVVAERGREFAWVVGEGYVRWSYTMAPLDKGTELTEFWEFLPAGIEMFHEKYGDKAPGLIEARIEDAHQGIPATLAAIKRIAEK